MDKKPVFSNTPKAYSSGNEYMDIVNELLRKNRGSRNLNLYDTGSNTPSILPEGAAVRPETIANGTNVGVDFGENGYVPSSIQQSYNQLPIQQQRMEPAQPYNPPQQKPYQEIIQDVLNEQQRREGLGISDEEEFMQYAQNNGLTSPTEQDYINYFLDSRNITDERSRSILSTLLSVPSKQENTTNLIAARNETENTPYSSPTNTLQNVVNDIGVQPVDLANPTPSQMSAASSLRERMKSLANKPLTQEELDQMNAGYTPIDEQIAAKDTQLNTIDSLLAKNGATMPSPTNTPEQDLAYKKLVGDTQQTNPIRQFIGNAVDVLGTTLGAGEGNFSEQIAGGPTINTGRKVKKNVGDFVPSMPSLIRPVQAAEPTPSMKSTTPYAANAQKAAISAPQRNIFKDIQEGATNIGNDVMNAGQNALATAGQGVKGIQNAFSNLMDENLMKNKDLSKMGAKNAVGEDSGQSAIGAVPGLSSTAPTANNQDAFFKAGGVSDYGGLMKPGITETYRGALDTSLFNDTFFQNPDNIANVFGSTAQGPEATAKYKQYMVGQYPIIPGHDSPTVKKVATGKYEDGSEWRVEYEDVDPVYYDNQYNKSVIDSIPANLSSSFKYTAPRTGQKAVAGKTQSGLYQPVTGDKSVPKSSGFSIPQQVQSNPKASNVFSVAAQAKPYSGSSSSFSIPTQTNKVSSSGYSAPSQNKSSGSSSSQSRPNPTPAPAPSRPSTPSYSAPQQTQSKPNAWSNPAPSYAKPAQQQSKPAAKPQSQNVFTNLVNTIKSWFK